MRLAVVARKVEESQKTNKKQVLTTNTLSTTVQVFMLILQVFPTSYDYFIYLTSPKVYGGLSSYAFSVHGDNPVTAI